MKNVVPSRSQWQYDPDLETYFQTGTWYYHGHTIQVSVDKYGWHVALDIYQSAINLKSSYDVKVWLGNRLR